MPKENERGIHVWGRQELEDRITYLESEAAQWDDLELRHYSRDRLDDEIASLRWLLGDDDA